MIAKSLSYVKVKSAPLHWRYYLKRIFQQYLMVSEVPLDLGLTANDPWCS